MYLVSAKDITSSGNEYVDKALFFTEEEAQDYCDYLVTCDYLVHIERVEEFHFSE